MTDDLAARLREVLAEFPGISAFDPDDITELLDEHDELRKRAVRAEQALAAIDTAMHQLDLGPALAGVHDALTNWKAGR